MNYNPDYRHQMFWDTNEPINFMSVMREMSQMDRFPREKYPATKVSKVMRIEGLIGMILSVISALIAFIISKSVVLLIVVFMIAVILCLGIASIVLGVARNIIINRNVTETITAKCIGYSISGGGSKSRRVMRSPVFKYNYRGVDHVAFDGVWSNSGSRLPKVGDDFEIKIDPNDPDELVWEKNSGTNFIAIAMGVFALILAGGFIKLACSDDSFRAAIDNEAPAAFTEATSEDGKRLIDDDYIDDMLAENGLDGESWTIGIRELDHFEYNSQSGKYEFYFAPDSRYEVDAISVRSENMTDAMHESKKGDEYYWIQVGDGGTIYCAEDVEYTGSKLK